MDNIVPINEQIGTILSNIKLKARDWLDCIHPHCIEYVYFAMERVR